MIRILDSNLKRVGVIKKVTSASRVEAINGENTLDFEAVLDNKLNALIDENTIFEINDDYFDTAYLKKEERESLNIIVESDHISYRLNNPEYNLEYFTRTGPPAYVLSEILNGTGFTVGTVEYSNNVSYSAQEPKSRRQILMEFVAIVGGEIDFNKFQINILIKRGNRNTKPLVKGKNIKVVSKTLNKREKDINGNPLVSYECEPIYVPGQIHTLGDDVLLIQNDLDIRESLRLVSIKYNPYKDINATLQFANYINGLEDKLYRIETTTVVKDKIYNGCRIGPEYGFEAIRSDNKARSYFRSDSMAFQSGDGSGTNWRDRLYYEYNVEKDEVELVFDGNFSADTIETIKLKAKAAEIAGFDIVQENEVTHNGGIIYDRPALGKFIRFSPFSSMDGQGGYNEDYGALDLGISDDRMDTLIHLRSDGYARFGLKDQNGVSLRLNDFLRHAAGVPGATDTLLYTPNFQIYRDGTIGGGENNTERIESGTYLINATSIQVNFTRPFIRPPAVVVSVRNYPTVYGFNFLTDVGPTGPIFIGMNLTFEEGFYGKLFSTIISGI